jgi:hypothetical protein
MGQWNGAAGQGDCRAIVSDGTYIYAGLNTSPAQVVKIDPTTMETVLTWTGASGQNQCYALDFDGTYLYAGFNTDPGQ